MKIWNFQSPHLIHATPEVTSVTLTLKSGGVVCNKDPPLCDRMVVGFLTTYAIRPPQ